MTHTAGDSELAHQLQKLERLVLVRSTPFMARLRRRGAMAASPLDLRQHVLRACDSEIDVYSVASLFYVQLRVGRAGNWVVLGGEGNIELARARYTSPSSSN